MKIIKKYTGDTTYMYPNGVLATPERMLKDFPAILTFTHIIETDESNEVCFAVDNLSAMRSHYNIDPSLTEEEAISAIQDIINTEPVVDDTPSAEERIAAALEYQVMSTLPDEEESTEEV